jgi:hypothetical protein
MLIVFEKFVTQIYACEERSIKKRMNYKKKAKMRMQKDKKEK